MESFNSLVSALQEVQNTDSVDITPYHNTIYDVVCSRPIFAVCIPIAQVDVIALLMSKISYAKLVVTIKDNKFVVDVYYYSQLKHRIKGSVTRQNYTPENYTSKYGTLENNTIQNNGYVLDGEYTIESFNTTEDYQLIMSFKDGLAQGSAVAKVDGDIQQILYNNGQIQERYVYNLIYGSESANIFQMDFYQFKVELIFFERMSGNILYVYNSTSKLIKKIQTQYSSQNVGDDNHSVGNVNISNESVNSQDSSSNENIGNVNYGIKKTTTVNANNDLLNITITNTCGNKPIQEEIYDPNKAVFILLNDNAINRIINTLSKYRTFTDTGLLGVITERNLLTDIPITLVTLKVSVDTYHSSLTIDYTNVIQISAYTSIGYKNITFDSEGIKM